MLSQSRHHGLALVTASKAENLYWLGRYTERVFTTLGQFFPFYDRVMDTDVDAFRPFARALDLPEDFEDFDSFVDSFLYDESNPDSVRSAIVSAFRNAVILRPELSSRLLQYIELAMGKIVDAARHGDAARDVYAQRDIADNMLAFWGGIENSPAEPTLKSLLFVGKYIERIDLYTRLGLSRDELAAPMRKLDGYLAPLGGDPLPQCCADGLRWLADCLPSRGYTDVAERLRMTFDRFEVVASDGSCEGGLNSMDMDAVRP